MNVTATCATPGATIRYTTNGSDPTTSSPAVASGAQVAVPVPATLKARAFKDGMNPSAIRSAAYARMTCVATFDPGAGTVDPGSMTVIVGEPYGSLPVAQRTGYTFDGWRLGTGAGGTPVAAGTIVTTYTNHTLGAAWTANKYTVSFNGNGSTGGSTPSTTNTYDAAQALPANGFIRAGFTFTGWATTTDGPVVYADMQSVTNLTSDPDANVPLYAVWIVNSPTCVVIFDPAPGTVEPASKTVTVGEPYGSLPTPTREGYTFAGWWTGAGGSGTQVTEATTVTTPTDHTLHAKWTANTYQVWYYPNNGNGLMPPSTHTYDVNTALSSNLFSRTGYTFGGWAESPGGDKAYDDRQVVVNLTSEPDGIVKLYAFWIQN